MSTLISAFISLGGVILTTLGALFGALIGVYLSLKIAHRESRDKYILAALSERLKAHQEAYDLSWDLQSAAHKSNEDDSHLVKCEKWYRENCLYLEPEARKAFFLAYRTAWTYQNLKVDWQRTEDSTDLKAAWKDISVARQVIENNVSKPLIAPDRYEDREYNYEGEVQKKHREQDKKGRKSITDI